jgi:hypothetical protein
LDNNIRVVLFRTPVLNQEYKEITPEYLMTYINQKSEVEFTDFLLVPMSLDMYGDNSHLNYKGAEVFSKCFSKSLKDNVPYHEFTAQVSECLRYK